MSLEILENVPLAPFTTLKIGGPARLFVKADSESEVSEAFEYANANGSAVFVLGGGSNILVSDNGFNGLVVQVGIRGISQSGELVTAAAGEDWDNFVAFCVGKGLSGVECLSGIPGFVGGTPVQNVGAYGQEVSETIVSVRCFDRCTLDLVDLSNEQCGFAYRKSIFNSSERDRYVVLAVTYNLISDGAAKIVYKDLVERFGSRQPTLTETREMVLKVRRAKSMVIDPSDPNSQSAGSFFKNPIVPSKKIEEIAGKLGIPAVPHFRFNQTEVKISAAWLIERAGFSKGFALGNAGISSNHTLAIVNRGGATAAAVIDLKNLIQERVLERFGIELQPEPVFVGF